MGKAEIEDLEYDWRAWARESQLAPPGLWENWLLLAGRGWGKTRVGAEWVRANVCGATPLAGGVYSRVALVAETAADGRDVMVEGASGLMGISPKGWRPKYEPTKRRLTWPNGAVATLYNAVEPDQLRGPQHEAAWCDELAKWRYAQQTWDMLAFGLRLGAHPRAIITTTPRPTPLMKALLAESIGPNAKTVITRGSTYENAVNLASSFIARLRKKYEGTRLGRQEIDAEILGDVPGSLWNRDQIERCRVSRMPTDVVRVVISVDPSGTHGKDDTDHDEGDDIGIVVLALTSEGRVYILEDATCNVGPLQWATKICRLYKDYMADCVIAEVNFGAAMVGALLRTVDPTIPFKEVHATRGKFLRAEPVAGLYSQKMVHHVGAFPQMEDEMIAMRPEGYQGGGSPNRLDAMVWGVTELVLAQQGRTSSQRMAL